MLKKRVIGIFLSAVLIVSSSITTLAATAENSFSSISTDLIDETYSISLDELEVTIFDENGNIIPQQRGALTAHTVGPGQTIRYRLPNGSLYSVVKGRTITFTLSIEKNNRIGTMGFRSPNGSVAQSRRLTRDGIVQSISRKAQQNSSYSCFLRNESAKDMIVTGGQVAIR